MTLLVNFIEVQLAWEEAVWNDKSVPWWVNFPITRAITWRSPKLGVMRLTSVIALVVDESGVKTAQAESAEAQLELYHWWKARVSRVTQSNDTEIYRNCNVTIRKLSASYPHIKPAWKLEPLWSVLERAYDEEDTAALHRLIDIRHHLWT